MGTSPSGGGREYLLHCGRLAGRLGRDRLGDRSATRELAQSAQRANEGINKALTEVTRIRLQATAGRTESQGWITQAHAQIQRAVVLSEGDGTTPELRQRVAQLSAELQQEQKDLQLLADLDRAWSAQAELDANRTNFDLTRAGPLLRQALQAYGLAIDKGKPGEVAAWITPRPEKVRIELLVALQILSDLCRPLGVSLHFVDGSHTVNGIMPDCPVARDGRLHIGDRVVAIGAGSEGPLEDIRQLSPAEVGEKLRGEPGTIIRFQFTRDDSDEVHTAAIAGYLASLAVGSRACGRERPLATGAAG